MRIYRLAYYIDHATAFIIDKDCVITKVETHIHSIIDLYDLESEISSEFLNAFREYIDWDKDWETVVEYVYDFMKDEKIFCVVADFAGKQVYVRPTDNITPSPIQMKALSDWAIEQGCSEEIITDLVVANHAILVKLAQALDRPATYTDVGHERGSNSNPWVMFDDDLVIGPRGESHHYWLGHLHKAKACGRIDHDKGVISLTHLTFHDKAALNYAESILRMDFPDYKIWRYGADTL